MIYLNYLLATLGIAALFFIVSHMMIHRTQKRYLDAQTDFTTHQKDLKNLKDQNIDGMIINSFWISIVIIIIGSAITVTFYSLDYKRTKPKDSQEIRLEKQQAYEMGLKDAAQQIFNRIHKNFDVKYPN
jgi:H+/gluconate symporter-like permease